MPEWTTADYLAGLQLLAAGNYAPGWRLYEARTAAAVTKPALPFPEWRGEPINGRNLLVWPEQGLGDKIMFARYFPLLDADVSVLCEPALARLFQANFQVEVIVASGATSFRDPDVWCLYGSLPYLLGGAEIPQAPYLSAETRRSDARIGICTRGSPGHSNDRNRSIPADQAERLLALPRSISLHVDDTGAADFLETAEIIAALDLVVTVDTAIAHLAGAMGKPVWILLPVVGLDWRWGAFGSSTTWYPSATLIRQGEDQGWEPVISEVLARLAKRSL